MRITSELINQTEHRQNPMGEHELILRELNIAEVENMGAAKIFESIDLSSNKLTLLSNFPKLPRVASLNAANNLIERLELKNLSGLRHLDLSYNRISMLSELAKLLPNLQHLSLVGNPVTRRQHYRLYVISKIPGLSVLDFERIGAKERERAKRLFNSSAGAALEQDVQAEKNAAKTFIPGESIVNPVVLTAEQKAVLQERIAKATSLQEIEAIQKEFVGVS